MPAKDVGGPCEILDEAINRLTAKGFRLTARSRSYRTPAYPAGSGPDFVNAVAQFVTDRDATELLAQLHSVEAGLGRVRHLRWGPRVIDLDLLDHGQRIHPDAHVWRTWATQPPAAQSVAAPDRLILPHPRLHERAFVLVPLRDVDPHWRHPVDGRTAQQMLDDLGPEALRGVVALT